MIANRLEQYDVEIGISPTTERILGGPLPVATLHSLCVRKNGDDVLCTSAQGTIRIRRMTEDEGFLLIQSIFDWYDEWLEKIELTLKERNYRRYVHLCAQAFGNPVLALDSNSFLSGLDSRGIDLASIPEWNFISEKGMVSFSYHTRMAMAVSAPVRRYAEGVVRFRTEAGGARKSDTEMEGLHAELFFRDNHYGTITVLEKRRKLTLGDVALLELLKEKSSLILAATDGRGVSCTDPQIMSDLLDLKPVTSERVDFIRSLIAPDSSPDSDFRLFLFRYDNENEKTGLGVLLQNTLLRRYPTMFTWNYHGDLLALTCTPNQKTLACQMLDFVSEQGYAKGLRLSVSLPFDELRDIPFFYEQAVFAVNRRSSAGFNDFYDSAGYFLLETADRKKRIFACEPRCRKIWESSQEGRKNLETLAVYLGHERASAAAAEELFIHKNTLSYRVRNMKELNEWNLDNPILRDYIRLSIYFLSREDENK